MHRHQGEVFALPSELARPAGWANRVFLAHQTLHPLNDLQPVHTLLKKVVRNPLLLNIFPLHCPLEKLCPRPT
eukprot:2160495-Amphidinium_carterae.1